MTTTDINPRSKAHKIFAELETKFEELEGLIDVEANIAMSLHENLSRLPTTSSADYGTQVKVAVARNMTVLGTRMEELRFDLTELIDEVRGVEAWVLGHKVKIKDEDSNVGLRFGKLISKKR